MDSAIKRHEPLYLKYRPQALGELVGQEAVKRTLTNAITHKRLAHAYLFTGPRGTGKTSTARILAKSMNCLSTEDATTEPCQTCACCMEITAGTSPCVLEIDAASNNSVDDARELIERAPLKAVGGRYKIYIIDECHMLTKEAFNALLKTIEQPPPGVVFILATTEEHKVLPTIISRCQKLLFRLIDQGSLESHLKKVAGKEDINISDGAITLISRRSGGGLRDALSTLDQAGLLSSAEHQTEVEDLLRILGALNEDVLLKLSDSIAGRDGRALLDTAAQLLDDGREAPMIVQELSRHFLNMTKVAYLAGEKDFLKAAEPVVSGTPAYLNGLLDQSKRFDIVELSGIVEALSRLEAGCKRTGQPIMHMEIGLLGICHRHELALVKELADKVERLELALAGQPLPAARPASQPASRPTPATSQTHSHPVPAPQHPVPAQQAQTLPQARIQSEVHPVPSPAPHLPAIQPEPAPSPAQIAASAATTGDSIEISSISPQQTIVATATQVSTDTRDQEMAISLVREDDSTSSSTPLPQSAANEQSDTQAPVDVSELEGTWTEILSELHRRSLPTYSLISTHGFPIQITKDELVVGVYKESFQKMLEGKAESLKAAAAVILGATPHVKVKVSQGKPQAKSAPLRTRSNADPIPQRQPQDTAPDNRDPGQPSTSSPEPQNGSDVSKETSRSKPGEDEPADQTMWKEAYKLFEGPGSRKIQ